MALYLVKPDGTVSRDSIISSVAIGAARDHGIDLATLPWADGTPEYATFDQLLALALRHGTKCSAGLVVDAALASVQGRPKFLQETFTNSRPSREAMQAQVEAMWPAEEVERRRALDESIEAGRQRDMAEAEGDAQRQLEDRAIDEDLRAHWTSLGGRPPQQ